MSDIDPDDVAAFAKHGVAVNETLAELREIATPKGCGVAAKTTLTAARLGEESSGEGPTEWYRVYPLDRPDEDGETFKTADEVREYLETR